MAFLLTFLQSQDLKMTTDTIDYTIENNIAFVTLNRPKALNALDLHMVQQMLTWLTAWETDPNIKAVVIQSTSEKAFCAGGDVRAVYLSQLENQKGQQPQNTLAHDFFSIEYEMNKKIFSFPKPYICFLNGITMGGGLGLSVHGSYRIVSETSLLAMPEAVIGYFTDVGATHFLNEAPGMIGKYLALTGHRLSAADALYAKLANYYIPLEKQTSLLQNLKSLTWDDESPHLTIRPLLTSFNQFPEPSSFLERHAHEIDKCFASNDLKTIIHELTAHSTQNHWAQEALNLILKGSALSQSIILEQLKKGKEIIKEFASIMKMEFNISQHFMNCSDFFEGIRALLIDKDGNPKFLYQHRDNIPEDILSSFFSESAISESFSEKKQKKIG